MEAGAAAPQCRFQTALLAICSRGASSEAEDMQHVNATVDHVIFGRGGNADNCIGIGWSAGEAGYRWMVDNVSEFWFDARGSGLCSLALDLHPLVESPLRPTQRVIVLIGETEVYRAKLSGLTQCDIQIPPAALPASGRIHVTIQHPDAISPMDLSGADDQRRLAFAVREARLRWLYAQDEALETIAPNEIASPAIIAEPAHLSTVFVGNCQMGALSTLYRRLLSPDSDHEVTYIASYNDATEENRRAISNATKVVQQVLNFVPRIGDLVTNAKVHLVPHASAAFLWPFGGTMHPRNRPEPTIERSGPYNGELGDSFLNRMILAGESPENALTEYLAADAVTVRRAERMMELHLQKQRERDAACDIHVADRIEAQLSSARLFRSPNHPEPAFAVWLAAEVFARMGEQPAAIAQLIASQPDALPGTETPIHPAVARHFGLAYAPPSRRYRYFNEGGFTFTEYVRRYMRYEWNEPLAEGMHLLWKKQADLALTKLERALPMAPRSAIGRMAVAEILARMGRLKDAVEYACQAVEIEPDNEGFVKRLFQLADQLRLQAPTSVEAGLLSG
jgi:tetratricopeptide (TPR) repeat protein